jgi:lipopolysaccharide transport system ATP-binding protein
MSQPVISVENISKYYRLGLIGGGTLHADLERWWAKARGRPDPLFKIGQEEQSNRQGDHIWALRDVTFQVQHGEVLGIIGRNGAGKSTLLKILSRVTDPTAGQIKIKGRVASLLEVGTGFHPELTGRENVYLNGAILGMKKAEIDRKFDEIVAFAEIEKFLDTPVKRYSSGMYVRLAFAVAAHLEPEILVVDEVLAVGDAQFQKKCLGKMGDVAKEGRTVLFVSHNMTAVKALCPAAILLSSGKIVNAGDSIGVVTAYLKQGENRARARVWSDPLQAPGGDKVGLKSARVIPRSDTDVIDVHTDLDLEFEFWNYQAGAIINFSMVLYTQEDVCVLNTASKPAAYPEGVVRGICHIPGDFLNDSTYRVRLLLVQDGRALVDDPDVLSFEVAEGKRNGSWHGKWVGIVRPQFDWTSGNVPVSLIGEG